MSVMLYQMLATMMLTMTTVKTFLVKSSKSQSLAFVPRTTQNTHLFFLRDYAPNETLDRYSDADIDDEEFEAMSAAARRAAEAKMARRDRIERGGRRGQRAARRSHMPNFLESDDEEDEEEVHGGLLSGMRRRARRQYDERKDLDDMEGVEDVSRLN